MTPIPEIVLRVTIVYVALIVLMRVIAGKREIGQLTPLDLLGMLLLSETVSPVFTRQDESLLGGLTAATTLIVLAAFVGRLVHRSRRAERWIDGEPIPLIREGYVDHEALDRNRITMQELSSALRKQGIEDARGVRLSMLEPDGTISAVKADESALG
jgi:uncharacterized membrane protein YcaP (DUF421 family)